MAISRQTMITTIQAGAKAISTKEIKAEQISNLSAMGSSNFPRVVTCFDLLAIYPSSQSVRAANKKIKRAKGIQYLVKRRVTRMGTRNIRINESLFGKVMIALNSYI